MELIGLVTVTFNSRLVLPDFFRSVFSQNHTRFRLYVVDNASSDDCQSLIAQVKDERMETTLNSQNIGVAAANNIGIRSALADKCDSVMLINNDTDFDPDLLESLLRGLRETRGDMIVPKIVYADKPNMIWSAGGYFLMPFGIAHHHGVGKNDVGQFEALRKVDYAPTTCTLISAEVFETIGLLDEKYFAYYEDTDFCLRAKRAGLKQYYWPQTTLRHKVSSLTGGHERGIGLRLCSRNQAYYIRKNYPSIWPLIFLGAQLVFLSKLLRFQEAPKTFMERQRYFWLGLKLFRTKTNPLGLLTETS